MFNEAFLGTELTQDDLELRALMRIPPGSRSYEAELFTKKWWDYRPLHPTLATYLFAEAYKEAIRDTYAKTQDVNEAVDLEVFKGEQDIFKREIDTLPFWRARQVCDRIGCRYDFALRFAMNRAADRGWRFFPRPNQLYEECLVRDAKDAWNAHLGHTFELAKHPRYLLVNDLGDEDQTAYRAWLVERCGARIRPQGPLSRCFKEGMLAVKHAQGYFDELVIREALRMASC